MDSINSQIKKLVEQFPLSLGWKIDEIAETSLGNYTGVGLLASHPTLKMALGASARTSTILAVEHAYYELLERILTLEHQSDFADIRAQKNKNSQWVFSTSNGVAAHSDEVQAKNRASEELNERDDFLGSWYGLTVPEKMDFPNYIDSTQSGFLRDDYLLESFLIPSFHKKDSPSFTTFVIGWPRENQNRPLIYGLGNGSTVENSIRKSWQEFVQRCLFLGEEELLINIPNFNPSPDYHLDYYLTKKSFTIIKDWINGKNKLKQENMQNIEKWYELRYQHQVQITSIRVMLGSTRKYFLAKAYHPYYLPLIFGTNYHWIPNHPELNLPLVKSIHPLA